MNKLHLIDPNFALDDVNIDTKKIREQLTVTKKVAERLVSETLFEVEGWKRIQAIPLAFESFEFNPDSVSLTFEEVQLPISIGNKHLMGGQSLPSTFLVSLNMNMTINTRFKHYLFLKSIIGLKAIFDPSF